MIANANSLISTHNKRLVGPRSYTTHGWVREGKCAFEEFPETRPRNLKICAPAFVGARGRISLYFYAGQNSIKTAKFKTAVQNEGRSPKTVPAT